MPRDFWSVAAPRTIVDPNTSVCLTFEAGTLGSNTVSLLVLCIGADGAAVAQTRLVFQRGGEILRLDRLIPK